MPEALDTTLEIADKCNVTISFDERHLPKFPVPDGETDTSYLRKLCEEALPRRYHPVTEEQVRNGSIMNWVSLKPWDSLVFPNRLGLCQIRQRP